MIRGSPTLASTQSFSFRSLCDPRVPNALISLSFLYSTWGLHGLPGKRTTLSFVSKSRMTGQTTHPVSSRSIRSRPAETNESTQTIAVPDRDAFSSDEEYKGHIERILSDYDTRLEVAKRQQLGYPIYHARDNVEELDLSPLDRFSTSALNNVGDPQNVGVFASHTHGFEVGVLRWFADLFHLEEFWGYVSSGGSESNLEALFIARETLPSAMTYVSSEAHFSIFKALRVLRMPYVVIQTSKAGEMNYDDLERALNASPYRHAIVVATCGTTMRGAIDCPRTIVDLLVACQITEYYLHVDAALSGIFVPLLDPHMLSFADVPISSIAVSGHKYLGVPIPCSVCLVRRKFIEGMSSSQVQYIGSNDLPMSCSRNGLYAIDDSISDALIDPLTNTICLPQGSPISLVDA